MLTGGPSVAAVPARVLLTILVLLLPAFAGCVMADDPGEPLALQMVSEHTGEVREWDLYVSEVFEHSPDGERVMQGFAFGLSPEGPFSIPGPEIRVTEGDLVRVRLHHELHTIHWHGVSLPWRMDGVPFVTQDLGHDVYEYEFVAWEPGTYWYHCHVEAPAHVDAGMFGAFIVEPADPEEDPPFDREETLILHEFDSQMFYPYEVAFTEGEVSPDRLHGNPVDALDGLRGGARMTAEIGAIIAHDATGTSTFEVGPRDHYPLYSIRYRPQYDVFMINGKSYPETEPLHISTGETMRIRLINAGQLVHTMHLHGHHFLVTHKDGYPLPAPYYADTIGLFPAERYDIYVEGYNPGLWDLHDHGGAWGVGGFTSNDFAFPGGMNTMLVYDDLEDVDLPHPSTGYDSGDLAAFAPSFVGHHR